MPHEEEQLLNSVIVPPVGVVMMAAVQVNVVPLTVELNATLVAVALQIVCGDAEPTGNGFTVTAALPLNVWAQPIPEVYATLSRLYV